MFRSTASWMGCGVLAAVLFASTVASGDDTRVPSPFDGQLLEAAKTYKTFKPVDFDAKFAPLLCRAPAIPYQDYQPSEARISASKDAGTHGQKLYFLFAKQKDAYLKLVEHREQAIGQIIVKESWLLEEATEADYRRFMANPRSMNTPIPFARRDGKIYRTAKQGELFIMIKNNSRFVDTDNGWTYGTVTPDGKTVTSAGRVESCISCHKDAKHDRLFGLPAKATTEPATTK